jgi:hypothetical protein
MSVVNSLSSSSDSLLLRSAAFSFSNLSVPTLYGIRRFVCAIAVSYRHPPRGGGIGRDDGSVMFDSEYADRGEWLFVAVGEGSLDSKENFRAC